MNTEIIHQKNGWSNLLIITLLKHSFNPQKLFISVSHIFSEGQ